MAIIGAGPAGASTAYFLSRFSPEKRVVLIERLGEDRYRRYHRMCGEAVSEGAFRELGLKPTSVLNRITRIKEEWPGDIVMITRANGYVIDRSAFLSKMIDGFLDNGGRIEFESVVGVVKGPAYTIKCASGREFRARYLVGADGGHSIVRRSLFASSPPVSILVRQFVCPRISEEGTLIFKYDSKYRGGYRWEFPSGVNTKIGFPKGTDHIDEDYVESHSRLITAGGLESLVADNVCLVGDSAGQTNPLTFGGIRPAMVGGKMAAEAISRDRVDEYGEWWRSCPHSSPDLLSSFRLLASMSNEELERSIKPFSKGLGSLSIRSLGSPVLRTLLKGYRLSEKYGW